MAKRTTSFRPRPTASPRRAFIAGVVALLAITTSGAARAEVSSVGVSLRGVACPDAESVVAALTEVLVHTQVRQVDGPADIDIEATDADVRITAFGTTKRFSGSCDERVKLLSAYVALGLEPPMPLPPVERPAEKSVEPPPVRPLPPPATQDPNRQSRGGIEASVSASVGAIGLPATAGHGGAVTPILGLRGALGVSPFAATLGASFALPCAVTTRGPSVTIARQAIDLGLRFATPLGRLTLAGEGGPVLARTVVVAEGLANAEPSSSQAELGLRLAAEVGLRLSHRLSATATLEGYGVPAPATLALRTTGEVGTMPAFGLGGTLGLRYQVTPPFP